MPDLLNDRVIRAGCEDSYVDWENIMCLFQCSTALPALYTRSALSQSIVRIGILPTKFLEMDYITS